MVVAPAVPAVPAVPVVPVVRHVGQVGSDRDSDLISSGKTVEVLAPNQPGNKIEGRVKAPGDLCLMVPTWNNRMIRDNATEARVDSARVDSARGNLAATDSARMVLVRADRDAVPAVDPADLADLVDLAAPAVRATAEWTSILSCRSMILACH